MTTSLQKQLQQLTAPQSSQFKQRRSRASLLYDSRQAALLDRDTVFLLGCDGFDQLVSLDSSFVAFRDQLFSSAVKDLQRTVLTREENKRIDTAIDHFLCHLSSYLLLKPAQKALEWLVYRFHVHEYNVDSLLRCALPYHESPLFSRIVQLLEFRSSTNRWFWLQCLQKPGLPLTKHALYAQCARDFGLLTFVCNMNKKMIEVLGSEARGLSASITFYISAISGTLRLLGSSSPSEQQMALLSAHLLRGLRSSSSTHELQTGSCLLLMQLAGVCHQGAPLSDKLSRVLFNVLTKNISGDLSSLYMGTLAVLARGQALKMAPIVSVRHFCRHAAELVPVLAELSQSRSPLVLLLCLLRGAIKSAIDGNSDDAVALVTRLVDDVTIPSTSDQCAVINLLFGVYTDTATKRSISSDEENDDDDDDDDCMDEDIEEGITAPTSEALLQRCVTVVCQPLKLLRRRYPIAWQQCLQSASSTKSQSAGNSAESVAQSIEKQLTTVNTASSVAPSILKLITAIDGPLHSGHLLQLLHPHETTRQLAVETVFQQLREEKCLDRVDTDRMSVYREAVISCLSLSADSAHLVSTVLRVPVDTLTTLVGADKLIELLTGYLNSLVKPVLDLSSTTTISAVAFDPLACRLCVTTICTALSARSENVSSKSLSPALPLSLLCTLLAMVPCALVEQEQGDDMGAVEKKQDEMYLSACRTLFPGLPRSSNTDGYLSSLLRSMTSSMTSSMISQLLLTMSRGAIHYQATANKQPHRLQLAAAVLTASYISSSAVCDIADARIIVDSLLTVMRRQADNTRAVPKAKHRVLNADLSAADILLMLSKSEDGDQPAAAQFSELILCVVNSVLQLCSKNADTGDEWRHLFFRLFCTSADCLAMCRTRCRPFYQAIIKSILSVIANIQLMMLNKQQQQQRQQKQTKHNLLYNQLTFLSAVWSDRGLGGCCGDDAVSDAARLTALLAANALVKSGEQTDLLSSIITESNCSLLCSALVALMSSVAEIREAGLNLCMTYIPTGSKAQLVPPHDKSVPGLISRLHKISDDIRLDASALSRWLQSRARSCYVQAVFASVCQPADSLSSLTNDVRYQLLRLLAPAVHRLDDTALSTALTMSTPLLDPLSTGSESLSSIERHLLSAQLSLFTRAATRGLHQSLEVWQAFSAALRCHTQCLPDGDVLVSPHQLIVSMLTEDSTNQLDESVQRKLTTELVAIICGDSVSENVSSNAKSVLARLPMASSLLAELIQQSLPTASSSLKQARHSRRKKPTTVSGETSNTAELKSLTLEQCRRLTAILETIQLLCSSLTSTPSSSAEKPAFNADKLLAPLFNLLHQLQQQLQLIKPPQPEEEEQQLSPNSQPTAYDQLYQLNQLQLLTIATVQLVVVGVCTDQQLVTAAGRISVDTLVQTVRHSSSVHVHRHALHVLCRIAAVLPDVVLHSVMSVFTFVGSSLLRQDNDFTFSIIEQTLDTVIPAVIRARSAVPSVPDVSSPINHQSGATTADDTALLSAFLPVLRVFCDAVRDIPRHRCVPLFVRLLRGRDSGGAPLHLWRTVALFMAQQTTAPAKQRSVLATGRHGNAVANKADEVSELCELAMSVCAQFDVSVQLDVVHQLLLMVTAILHRKLDSDETADESDAESTSESDVPDVSSYSALFDLDYHTDAQSYRFCINCVSFVTHLIVSDTFVAQNEQYRAEADNTSQPQTSCSQYQQLFLTAVGVVNSCSDYTKTTGSDGGGRRLTPEQLKFARVLLARVTDLLDKMNCLLPASLFIDTVCGLLSRQPPLHPNLRRKTIELLAVRVQHQLQNHQHQHQDNQHQLQLFIEPFSAEHTPKLLDVLHELTRCVDSCDTSTTVAEAVNGSCDIPASDVATGRECVVSRQTALYAIKLLVKLLAEENAQHFLPVMHVVLNTITALLSPPSTMNGVSDLPPVLSPPLLSSALLCLAQLCTSLGARAVLHVTQTATVLLSVLSQSSLISKELVALSAITAVHKLIGALSAFLSPHLPGLLLHICHLSVMHGTRGSTTGAIASNIQARLRQARSQLAAISLRLLLPVVDECLQQLSLDGDTTVPAHYSVVCSILTECVVETEMTQISSNIVSLQNILLRLLDCRCLCTASSSLDGVDRLENDVIHLMTSLVPRLSENTFRPLFLRVQEWALGDSTAAVWKLRRDCQQNGGDHHVVEEDDMVVNGGEDCGVVGERVVTFFRLADALAETLRGLFVLFAGQFYDQLATVVEVNCSAKQNGRHPILPKNEALKCQLAVSSLDCLNKLCMYDTEEFINNNRFQRIMQPLIDQFENELGSPEERADRVTHHLVPCVVNFLLAPADDTLWKTAHYQILLKLRHSSPQVRLHVLEVLSALSERLHDDYAGLLPETVAFFGELLEDEDERVEASCQRLVKQLEQTLGESLQKYF